MRSGNKVIAAALMLAVSTGGMAARKSDARAHPAPASQDEAAYESLPEAPMTPDEPAMPSRAAIDAATAADGPVVLGDPYMVDGKSYVPVDVPRLDEVGYAAVLTDAAVRRTANGEPYVAGSITAAHRTLPLPSYVEVTAIATGRTILVRINDRGPLLNDRIIALSPGAAQQLGIATDPAAGVRVRKVNPTEQDRRILRSGGRAAERFEAPLGLRTALEKHLPPPPAPLSQPVRTAGGAAASPVITAKPAPIRPVTEAKAEAVKLVPVQPSAPAAPPAKVVTPSPVKVVASPPVKVATPPPVKVAAPLPAKAVTPPPAKIAVSPPVKAETPPPAKAVSLAPPKIETPSAPPAETGLTLATQDTEVVASQGDTNASPEVRVVRPIRSGRAPTPTPTRQPAPAAVRPAPAEAPARATRGAYIVQVAALSSRGRADALARSVGGYVAPAGSLFRVRTGPYASDVAARAALGQVHGKGYAEARVMANDAR